MQTMFIKTEHAEQLDLPTKATTCGCGQTYSLLDAEEQLELVVCDGCREDAPYNQQY